VSPDKPSSRLSRQSKLPGFKTKGLASTLQDKRVEQHRRTPNRHDKSATYANQQSVSTRLSGYKTEMMRAEEQLQQEGKLHAADRERRWKLLIS